MQKMQLSAERVHLLQKVAKKERDPLEILACTVWSALLFLWVFLFVQSKQRHDDEHQAPVALFLGVGVGFAICAGISIKAYVTLKNSLPRRNLCINLAVCSWGVLIAGFYLGDRNFWLYTTNIYSYRDLVSYVDIDPAGDRGQAFMDTGHVYFKEHSYVLRQKYNKFKNADTYCVAPIIRGNFNAAPGSTVMNVNGNVIPDSGTYDWWAVGTNCCGEDGASSGNSTGNFTCGEVGNPLARSGMRILSDTKRPFYLLAVQEWSATYGLPVKHPLFFTWVKDPLETEDQYSMDSSEVMWQYVWYVLLFAFIFSFLLHMLLHRNKIY